MVTHTHIGFVETKDFVMAADDKEESGKGGSGVATPKNFEQELQECCEVPR